MDIIGKRNFNYQRECRIITPYQFPEELDEHTTPHT